MSIAEDKGRFMAWIQPDLNGCWIWQGFTYPGGYGGFSMKKKNWRAHRAAYMLFKGDPTGFDVLHSCDNPSCVNPEHLSLGDDRKNMLECVERGRHPVANKTHCPKGHPYAGTNLGITKQAGRGTWNRVCRTCHRDRQRARNKRLKLERAA